MGIRSLRSTSATEVEFVKRWLLAGALAAIALGGAVAASGQVSPNGDEFQVNTYTTSYQENAAIASDANGNFVVVWQSDGSSGGDTSGYSVQAQRYDATGNALGGEFLVNTVTTGEQSDPAVASDPSGNFVVVWKSAESSGSDTNGWTVQAQRFDPGGSPAGDEFQVNSYTTGDQYDAAVATGAAGSFVVVWASDGSSGTDTAGYSIQAQRYDGDGIPIGSEFQVNTYTTGDQAVPAITSDPAGNFVVVWSSDGSGGTDNDYASVQAQRYDASGSALGGEFQVNTYTTSSQSQPSVARDSAGNFVVAWNSNGSSGTDTSYDSVQAQRYDADGNPIGGEFQVNSYTTSPQDFAAVASDPAGGFVVIWRSRGSSGTDTDSPSVQGQRYRADGSLLGGEFQVNTYTTNDQDIPAVATDGSGNFVVAWESYGSSGTDSSYTSVHVQRYDGLFRDGFESGDMSRWSAAVP